MSLYCPKCKNEYQEGYTVCSDCHCDLVAYEDLFVKKPIYFGNEKEIRVIAHFLGANGIEDVDVICSENELETELFVSENDEKKAKKLLQIYLNEKLESQMKQELEEQVKLAMGTSDSDEASDLEKSEEQKLSDLETLAKMYEPAKIHENAKEKGEEYKSTGLMLVIMGVIGVIVDVLLFLDKLPIHFVGVQKYLNCGLLGVMFLAFAGFGIASIQSAKKLAIKGEAEEDLKEKAISFLHEHATDLKEAMNPETLSALDETEAYFAYSEKMKNMLMKEFTIEESLIDEIIEEIYDEIVSK